MSAIVTPTRRSLLQRLRTRLKCAHLRLLIRWADEDLRHMQETLDQLPLHIELMSNHVTSLQVELIVTEQE